MAIPPRSPRFGRPSFVEAKRACSPRARPSFVHGHASVQLPRGVRLLLIGPAGATSCLNGHFRIATRIIKYLFLNIVRTTYSTVVPFLQYNKVLEYTYFMR